MPIHRLHLARSRPSIAAVAVSSVLMLFSACATTKTSTADPSTSSTEATTVVSSIAPSTTFDNPFSDAEIADRLLLSPDEYGTGWQLFQFKNVALDRTIAATVPGCSPYLDTVFEGPGRTAATNHRWFHAPAGRGGAMSQYVVVFPTDEAAVAMYQAVTSERFQTDCFQPYKKLAAPDGNYCCNLDEVFPAPLWDGALATTPTSLGADDLSIRTGNQQKWADATGTVHGPETFDSATIRVGRTVTVIEAIRIDEFGQPFISEEQFRRAIAKVSERAIHALGGVNH